MSDTPPTEPSFEQAMERLEEIVTAMEGDQMPLDEMVSRYENGMKLLQICRQRIENARRRVEQINTTADGRAELAPFEPGESAPAPASPAEDLPKPATPTATATPPVRRRPAPARGAGTEGDKGDEIRLF